MTFEFITNLSPDPTASIIPVVKDDQLAVTLSGIAAECGIDEAALQQDFKADFCEILPLYRQSRKYFLLGLGTKGATADLVRAFRSLAHRYKGRIPERVHLSLAGEAFASRLSDCVEAAVNGLYLGEYRIGKYKSDDHEDEVPWREGATLVFEVPEDNQGARRAAEKGLAMARTQESVMQLVNAPSNKKRPVELAEWALRSGKAYGYRVEVMDLERIRETGLHALLAVNQGSSDPPAFIMMEYQPPGGAADLPKIGLVGKGVTFDTGGLSIKPSTNMHYMKSDMGGAAAVFGTMEMAAKLQLPVHLIGIVPATDNSVDGRAVKPSDVIGSYSGKTIEVIDTDAEGRLILADGLAYMIRHYQPEVLIDLATLTGSTVRTLGYHAAALFTNNEGLYDRLRRVADETGERVWRLPLWEIYEEDIKSDVADVRNFSGKPIAGAIGAAKFLEFFTDDHPAWAHLDIAGVAFGDSEFSIQKSATAYGIRLLVEYLTKYSR